MIFVIQINIQFHPYSIQPTVLSIALIEKNRQVSIKQRHVCPVSSHGTGMWKRLIRIILTGNRIFIIWLIFNFLKKKYGLRSNSIIIGNYALRRRKIYRRLFSLKNNFCMKAQKQTNVQTNKQYFKYNSSRK